MTATDGEALLQAIIEEPEDDAHRLVYADWCDDSGQPGRAEFIRAQLRHEALGSMTGSEPDYDPDEWCRVIDAEGKYDYERGVWWCDSFTPAPAPLSVGFNYRRGFVEVVECALAAWRKHGPTILLRHPVVRVELSDKLPTRVGNLWQWTRDVDEASDDLPADLFDLLDMKATQIETLQFKFWLGEKEAKGALSDACLLWADLPNKQPHRRHDGTVCWLRQGWPGDRRRCALPAWLWDRLNPTERFDYGTEAEALSALARAVGGEAC